MKILHTYPGADGSVKFVDTKTPDELDAFIRKGHFNLGIGMGLSALKIASYGIPTILLDPAYSDNDYNGVRWLHETEGFDLGSFKIFSSNANKSTLTEMIGNCNLEEISLSQVQFLARYFELHKLVDGFIDCAVQASMTVNDLKILSRINILFRLMRVR